MMFAPKKQMENGHIATTTVNYIRFIGITSIGQRKKVKAIAELAKIVNGTTKNIALMGEVTIVQNLCQRMIVARIGKERSRMNNDKLKELNRREAEENKKRDKEIVINPLSQYSTTQLKKELRRRKNE